MEQVRLNKYLKDQDICSRRKADEFISKGYIKVNGNIVTELGFRIDPAVDKVEVLPGLRDEISQFKYILLNKPKGYVCSKHEDGCKTIFELLPKIKGLAYAGRLDKDSHGLVLLSNDGKFVYSIFGKEFLREKEYIVKVNKPLTQNFILKQGNGSIILDGRCVRRAKVKQINENAYQIILTEGINRQIRRMAENQGYNVIDLKRVRIDNISDKALPLGKWRDLTKIEIQSILSNKF